MLRKSWEIFPNLQAAAPTFQLCGTDHLPEDRQGVSSAFSAGDEASPEKARNAAGEGPRQSVGVTTRRRPRSGKTPGRFQVIPRLFGSRATATIVPSWTTIDRM